MPNLFRHLTDYVRSQLAFSGLEKNLKEFCSFEFLKRDCFVAPLLAMTLFFPFFALPSYAADDEITVSVPEYVKITREITWSPTQSTNVSNQNTLTIPHAMGIQYNFDTNTVLQLYLSVKAPVQGGGFANAWDARYQSAEGTVVFTKNDYSTSEASIINALNNSSSPENNSNAIAFVGYWGQTGTNVISASSGIGIVETNFSNGKIIFCVANAEDRKNSRPVPFHLMTAPEFTQQPFI